MFCTKNPIPIVDKLSSINKPILFHVTLTPYKKDLEPGIRVNSKAEIIDAIKKISTIIGSDNLYVRYDPILISDHYTLEYHIKAFSKLCSLLDGYVKHIIISFVDDYKNVRNNLKILNINPFTKKDYEEIGIHFSEIVKRHHISIQTCFEEENLVEYGFLKKDCVDGNLAFKLTGKTDFKKWKARGCNCIEMVDIGSYNCCKHFCKYCYANYDEKMVIENTKKHDDNSSLLIGHLENSDIIKIRRK